MVDDRMPAIGRCYSCKRTFGYQPSTVMMIEVDPETGLLPGMSVTGRFRDPSPEVLARVVKQPVCQECVDRAKRFAQAREIRFETWHNPG
ncbi:hypothetical protein [Nonomuraea soli]|uniref:Uncharacterized protein n=1 Tax=Nonomuraea soli TaxID=1032476 RepID=A0A7W0HQH0_9ACTN|nr:hypothetical protein [Nonomuraea soli]MBA2891641.1 hypothetical protein [Nonomuraea soli]